jgi:hypothetical protein
VEEKPHRFDRVELRVNGHEIGHLHGGRWVDLPFPVRVRNGVRKELVAAGRAQWQHVLPQTGWVSYPIRGEEDVEGALELFRLNYERLTARKRGSSGPDARTVGSDAR